MASVFSSVSSLCMRLYKTRFTWRVFTAHDEHIDHVMTSLTMTSRYDVIAVNKLRDLSEDG